jgi:hypothetical protein
VATILLDQKKSKSGAKHTQNRGKKTKLIEKNPKKFKFILKLVPAWTYRKNALKNKGLTMFFACFP